MSTTLRVILEIGKKRRVVAAAYEWPGLDRWGTSEDDALAKLASYLPRYTDVAQRAGLASEFEASGTLEIIERVPGSSSTDFWGIAHVPSETERNVLSAADLERRLAVLQATWAYFGDAAIRVSRELRPGTRSAGRTREQIIRHTYMGEPQQFTRKVEVRTPLDQTLTPDGLAAHRQETLDAIRAYNAEGKAARTWPIQFLVRRIGHHVMDHAWELEDRDLTLLIDHDLAMTITSGPSSIDAHATSAVAT